MGESGRITRQEERQQLEFAQLHDPVWLERGEDVT